MTDDPASAGASGASSSGLLRKIFRKLNIFALWRHVAAVEQGLGERLDRVHDQGSGRLDEAEQHMRTLQAELEMLRDQRAVALDRRIDKSEARLGGLEDRLSDEQARRDRNEAEQRVTATEVERLRDAVVPAAVRRSDVLLERQAAEIEELASLVERVLLGEPLPAPQVEQAGLADALKRVQPELLAVFRGDRDEIHHRLQPYLEELREAGPVLDLGCGRGELLLILREAGIPAVGIEADPALVQAALRRGLELRQGDLLEVLRGEEDDSWGAVTAIHVFEHLPPAVLNATLAEAFRVLRPGGKLIAEGPNPGSIRVAASLYWLDPTHQHPLHPETLEVYARSVGFGDVTVDYLNPFPEQQWLVESSPAVEMPAPVRDVQEQLDRLRSRLDELLNGHRDFSLRAVKPGGTP